MDRGKQTVHALALGLIGVAAIYATGYLYFVYLSEWFAYHDLGLINDFLASLIYHRRLFYVFDMDVNHLTIIFAPSLLLWTPFYAFFDSQFLLIVLNMLSLAGCVWAFLELTYVVFGPRLDPWALAAAYALFLVVVARNVFVWNIMTAAHFEVFYSLVAAWLIYALIAAGRLWLILGLFFIALGVRQDAGFFLAFQLLAVALLPQGMIKDRRRLRRLCLPLAALGFAYTVWVAKFVFPWLGVDERWHATRFWAHYGSSFEAIARAMLTSPGRVIDDVIDSAAVSLNGSFLWLHWLNPVVALFTNAPGILLYTTSTPHRKYLTGYNSSFIIVGMLLGFVAGLYTLDLWVRQLTRRRGSSRIASMALMAALALLAVVAPRAGAERATGIDLQKRTPADGRRVLAFIERGLARCDGIETVATDFRSAVFLPNRVGKYLPDHYQKADAAFYFPGGNVYASRLKRMPEFFLTLQQDPQFKLAAAEDGMAYFVKAGRRCGAA
ncbi:MAG TPA: DUF2079 domain-containing protein [Candidatus Binatia bacterium]|jgi:uncharacterized membrane protein